MSLKRTSTADGSISPPPTKRRNTPPSVPGKATLDFFKPVSQKGPDPCRWRTVDDSLLVCTYNKSDTKAALRPRKIAAFDFDSTLISTSSGKKFGRTASDWKWWHANVAPTLHRLVEEEDYLVAIVSNQGGLGLDPDSKTVKQDRAKVAIFKEKAAAVLKTLDLPVSLYAATKYDLFRKPRTGMWEKLLADHNLTAADVDLAGSVFVGDAAGRIAGPKGSKDFSSSDRDLAANVGIQFYTPEEYFLSDPPRQYVRSFDPSDFLTNLVDASTNGTSSFTKRNDLDIVLFVGSPGAGKSTFYWQQLQPVGYERVNQDILKTREKCLATAAAHLAASRSVAVDATNPDPDVRSHWIKLATQFEVPIRCVYFTASSKLCEHNDAVRALGGACINPENRTMLPRMAFAGFAKRFIQPSVKEGFQDIYKVDFVFQGDETAKRVWRRYWISG
ncbi:PNK3P-domain-containing protein [Myriangium duriaei CBS 260.36]|uniref:PNK3P-domain-containing protein n=1 Tax=Myriangium duriaei CBS 260.36 TaxID=1168546 RepID=A0A9P4MF45_9PEZI|nr:PNK3P-domain-containing protein [Myriangium duriaei CBS 260.36]